MTKNIGISYYHLDLSSDRVRDAARHDDDTGGSGDLCLTVRHYYSEGNCEGIGLIGTAAAALTVKATSKC